MKMSVQAVIKASARDMVNGGASESEEFWPQRSRRALLSAVAVECRLLWRERIA